MPYKKTYKRKKNYRRKKRNYKRPMRKNYNKKNETIIRSLGIPNKIFVKLKSVYRSGEINTGTFA